ncbi:MAG: SBBP repeat-containing protein [Thermoplasmata archaeon]
MLDALYSRDGYFIENRGQVNDLVRYYSTVSPAVGFRDDGVMFLLREEPDEDNEDWREPMSPLTPPKSEPAVVRTLAYFVRFEGANKVTPIGRDRLSFNSNFFFGEEPTDWHTEVPTFGEVVYENLYDGIDLVFKPSPNGIKYEFIVRPGAYPGMIRAVYRGVESLHLDETGITIQTALGTVHDALPYSYQGAQEVPCKYVLHDVRSYGFACDDWDVARILIIDPLVYSTFIGGGSDDFATSLAVDGVGNVFITGWTSSVDFPTTVGAFNRTHGGSDDAFVVKLDASGGNLVYATYLGGNDIDYGRSLAVDETGNAYVSGTTLSMDFPVTPGAFDTVHSGGTGQWDAFVTKLNHSGSALVYSTFVDGSGTDYAYSIAVDTAGSAYVAGKTWSNLDFPTTPGAFDTTFNDNVGYIGGDAFVFKLAQTGDDLVYSTYVGGGDVDGAYGIAVDSAGNAYVTGDTASDDFPTTPGAFNRTMSTATASFAFKLNPSGSALVYSTYLGSATGTGGGGRGITVDSFGNAFVVGITTDFPVTPGAFDTTGGNAEDAFVAKLNVIGSDLVYATYLGGNDHDIALSVAVDSVGCAHVTGRTDSTDFPVTPDALDKTYGGRDAYVTQLDALGSALVNSTFLGGNSSDSGSSIAVDSEGSIYITGSTSSSDFPVTADAFDTTLDMRDAFVVKMNPTPGLLLPDLEVLPGYITFDPPSPVDVGTSVIVGVEVHNTGHADAIHVVVRFHDGQPTGLNQINGDQIIPVIDYIFRKGYAMVLWLAVPPASHDICVVADPDNLVIERNETNNQACAQIQVIMPPIPDLTIYPSGISFSPASPYVEGATVQVNATIHNIGGNVSGATVTRFHDGMPPSPQIGIDQPLPPIPMNGTENVSVFWTASLPGSHEICVVADPDDIVAEISETNNMACVLVQVLSLPDLIPLDIDVNPSLPLPDLTLAQVNLTVSNEGDIDTGGFDVLLFDDSNGNGLPDLGEDVDLHPLTNLTGHSQTNVTFSWTATPPGVHDLCAYVDPPPGAVNESNETNNVACREVQVVSAIPPSPPTDLEAILSGWNHQNVTLEWTLSPDDGGGLNVIRYDIYRNESYDSSGEGYYLLGSVPNGTSTYVDEGAGEGDYRDYFYYVCAFGDFNVSSCTTNQAGKFTRPLAKGPNLVSIPLIQSNESIEHVLQTVNYDKAWTYDSLSKQWKWYMKYKEYRRGLYSIDHSIGLWINVTENSNLTVAGVVPAQTSIQLYEGWNLVGFPSFNSSYTINDLKLETGASRVEGYDSLPPYYLRVLGDGEIPQAGEAYWVRVEADADWIVEVS